mmetsp:Transcript_104351/g.292386  ORF Transcript_104351/g.292386 Transcript_104351/m.292386 type:complete len:226 (+) Transcript_104351:1436-2113(+)
MLPCLFEEISFLRIGLNHSARQHRGTTSLCGALSSCRQVLSRRSYRSEGNGTINHAAEDLMFALLASSTGRSKGNRILRSSHRRRGYVVILGMGLQWDSWYCHLRGLGGTERLLRRDCLRSESFAFLSFLCSLLELCFRFRLNGVRQEKREFFQKIRMFREENRDLFQYLFDATLLFLIGVQNLKKLLVCFGLVRKSFLNCCHVVDRMVEFHTRWLCLSVALVVL